MCIVDVCCSLRCSTTTTEVLTEDCKLHCELCNRDIHSTTAQGLQLEPKSLLNLGPGGSVVLREGDKQLNWNLIVDYCLRSFIEFV